MKRTKAKSQKRQHRKVKRRWQKGHISFQQAEALFWRPTPPTRRTAEHLEDLPEDLPEDFEDAGCCVLCGQDLAFYATMDGCHHVMCGSCGDYYSAQKPLECPQCGKSFITMKLWENIPSAIQPLQNFPDSDRRATSAWMYVGLQTCICGHFSQCCVARASVTLPFAN